MRKLAWARPCRPPNTSKCSELYRYHVSQSVRWRGRGACANARLHAADIEAAVVDQLRVLFRSPEIVVATWRSTRQEIERLSEAEVRDAMEQLDPLWDELFPAEQARIVQLLVRRIDIAENAVNLQLRVEGLGQLVRDLSGTRKLAA